MQNTQLITPNDQSINQEAEISLQDILNFLAQSWKKLLVASILGTVGGFVVWYFFIGFTAEINLQNNFQQNSQQSNLQTNNRPSASLDIVGLRFLQKSLPQLIAQIIEENKVPDGQQSVYRDMKDEQFWQKHVQQTYAFSKLDAKEFLVINKEMESAGSSIVNLNLIGNGKTKEEAIKSVSSIENVFRTGGAYLSLRSLLNQYQTQILFSENDINRQMMFQNIELGYQRERVRRLEELHLRFPNNASSGSQVVDPKESGAKFLPLTTQIIAANQDINLTKENLQRLQDQLVDLKVVSQFYEQANPQLGLSFDGIALVQTFLEITSNLQKNIQESDLKKLEALAKIKTDLEQIQSKFTNGLAKNTEATALKKGLLKTLFGGLALGLFAMLTILLVRRAPSFNMA